MGLSETLFSPPNVSNLIGVVWNQGGLTASAFGNYKGGVTNRIDEVKSASFTTFVTTLRYDTGERGDAWTNLGFALSLRNLLDREPPLYTPASADAAANVPPYDHTNYSPIGRRSEEHTSDLTSLKRISNAVFGLNRKPHDRSHTDHKL